MDKVLAFVKSVFPKAHTRFAGMMLLAGIGLIVGPSLAEKLALAVLGVHIDGTITQYDQVYGVGLVLWASLYHILMTKLSEISSALTEKEKHEARRALLAECRRYLEQNEFSRGDFAETVLYSRLRPHLTPALVAELEKSSNELTVVIDAVRGSGVDNYKCEILDELVEIEKKWNLF